MILDRTSKVPLYVQLRDLLQKQITEGNYRPGALFPTEREIAYRYHVSRTTIREAMVDLVRLGYLVRRQGKGTFIARSRGAFDAAELSSFSEDMRKRGMVAKGQVLALEEVVPDDACKQHFGDRITKVVRIYRLRMANDKPIALQASYLPSSSFTFTKEELTDASLYQLLAERYGIEIASADEVIAATVATSEQAQLLGIETGAPLLRIDRYAYSQTGQPIEYAFILYRADKYKFYVHQVRGG